ncbi:hypothetical protein PMI18_00939 [Pseudomonas sp. GM102]|nr:hypothetical protein PMI18_00939 [Pseudomonas sp. GM102]
MQAWMHASQCMQLRYGRRFHEQAEFARQTRPPPSFTAHIQCNKPESYFAVITDSLVIPARSIEAIARATSP